MVGGGVVGWGGVGGGGGGVDTKHTRDSCKYAIVLASCSKPTSCPGFVLAADAKYFAERLLPIHIRRQP